MNNRLLYREMFSKRLAVPLLSYKACRILESNNIIEPELLRPWLLKQSTRNVKGLGLRTYNEMLAACGMAVPAKAPTTLGAKLRAAEGKLEKIQTVLAQVLVQYTDLEDPCLYRAGLTADGVQLGEYERNGIKCYGRFLVEHCLNRVMEVAK